MGDWGSGTFQNDEAHEWLADLQESPDSLTFLRQTLESARGGEYLVGRAPQGVLAAAELVAIAGGAVPPDRVPDAASSWLRQYAHSLLSFSQLAIEAVRKVGEKSELREIANEAGPEAVKNFEAQLDSLIGRLTR